MVCAALGKGGLGVGAYHFEVLRGGSQGLITTKSKLHAQISQFGQNRLYL